MGRAAGSPSHMLRTTYTAQRVANETCRKISYRAGQAHECGEPTENGATYCGLCKRHLITLTDRKSPEQVAPEQYHWTNDKPRKRA